MFVVFTVLVSTAGRALSRAFETQKWYREDKKRNKASKIQAIMQI